MPSLSTSTCWEYIGKGEQFQTNFSLFQGLYLYLGIPICKLNKKKTRNAEYSEENRQVSEHICMCAFCMCKCMCVQVPMELGLHTT